MWRVKAVKLNRHFLWLCYKKTLIVMVAWKRCTILSHILSSIFVEYIKKYLTVTSKLFSKSYLIITNLGQSVDVSGIVTRRSKILTVLRPQKSVLWRSKWLFMLQCGFWLSWKTKHTILWESKSEKQKSFNSLTLAHV